MQDAVDREVIPAIRIVEYMDGKLRNLPCKRIQVDEAWAFIYAKEKNVATAKAAPQDAGDVLDVDGDL